MFKITIIIITFLFLSGCLQLGAFLIPGITAGTTGNVYKAALQYSANTYFKKTTGKSLSEHAFTAFEKK